MMGQQQLNRLTQLTLATLFTHELDAMAQAEWRLLYVLRDLSADQGQWWFVALHVPLFWALIALTHHAHVQTQSYSRLALAGFAVVHAALHLRLRNDPLSGFNTPLSWALILGCAAMGLAYLCGVWLNKRGGARHRLG